MSVLSDMKEKAIVPWSAFLITTYIIESHTTKD